MRIISCCDSLKIPICRDSFWIDRICSCSHHSCFDILQVTAFSFLKSIAFLHRFFLEFEFSCMIYRFTLLYPFMMCDMNVIFFRTFLMVILNCYKVLFYLFFCLILSLDLFLNLHDNLLNKYLSWSCQIFVHIL